VEGVQSTCTRGIHVCAALVAVANSEAYRFVKFWQIIQLLTW
jgi:hypothetical protein